MLVPSFRTIILYYLSNTWNHSQEKFKWKFLEIMYHHYTIQHTAQVKEFSCIPLIKAAITMGKHNLRYAENAFSYVPKSENKV